MKPYIILASILLLVTGALLGYKLGWPSSPESPSKTLISRVAEKAIAAKNPEVCRELAERIETPASSGDGKGAPYVTYPQDECFMKYLMRTRDRQTCELVRNKKYCYNFIAEVYSEPSVCEKIAGTPSSWKDIPICRAVATLDIRECDVFDLPEHDHLVYEPKTDCLTEVVLRTHDVATCSGIKGVGYGDSGLISSWNYCLKIAGCDKPERRSEICSQRLYPEWTLPEEKKLCLTEKWDCPEMPRR